MHATTEQLLDIKDGIETPLNQHVSSCHKCQEKLKQLKQIQQDLYNLSSQLPKNIWQNIYNQAQPPSNKRKRYPLYALAASLVASIVLFIIQSNYRIDNTPETNTYMIALMADSKALESVINAKLDQEAEKLDRASRFRIERLKWRLKLIDQKIEKAMLSSTDTQINLWQDRIRALRTINESFYTSIHSITQIGEI